MYNTNYFRHYLGRVIAQAVSRRIPTAAARVRAQVRSYGICGGQSGHVFSKYFGFPCQFSFHRLLHTSSIIRGWYNRPISGRHTKWTQSHPIRRNPPPPKKKTLFVTGQVGSGGDVSDLYSGGARFESWLGHWLSWLWNFMVFIQPFQANSEKIP
jgi:hypothetical protein